MINEKGLVAAMKDAWKETRYSVVAYEENGLERIALHSGAWFVDAPRIHFPRKALALIVEHAGEIPENAAYSLSKTGGQQLLEKTIALQDIKNVYNTMKETAGMDIEKTRITWDNLEVWQKPEDMEVMLFDAFYLNIIDWKADDFFTEVYGQIMVSAGDRSLVIVLPAVSEKDKPYLSHLSQMQWTGGKE